jgi:hypothetical protein
MLQFFFANNGSQHEPYKWQEQARMQNQRDFQVQIIVSVVFGLSAFLAFCVGLVLDDVGDH